MDIIYTNETKYSKEEMARFQKFHSDKYNKKFRLHMILFIFIILIGIIINITIKNIYAIIILLSFTALSYFYYFNVDIKRKNKSNKQQIENTFKFDFYNNFIEISKKNENTSKNIETKKRKILYLKFNKVYETKYNFYLYLTDDYAVLINKDCFTKGNVNDFRAFIKSKIKMKK